MLKVTFTSNNINDIETQVRQWLNSNRDKQQLCAKFTAEEAENHGEVKEIYHLDVFYRRSANAK